MTQLYYTAPNDQVFEEVKSKAIEIWATYDNTYGYVDEKVGRIKGMKNVRDNLMFIVGMFDPENQRRLANMLSERARKTIADRLKDGGMPDAYNYFL